MVRLTRLRRDRQPWTRTGPPDRRIRRGSGSQADDVASAPNRNFRPPKILALGPTLDHARKEPTRSEPPPVKNPRPRSKPSREDRSIEPYHAADRVT
jgi:hypothetical protein